MTTKDHGDTRETKRNAADRGRTPSVISKTRKIVQQPGELGLPRRKTTQLSRSADVPLGRRGLGSEGRA